MLKLMAAKGTLQLSVFGDSLITIKKRIKLNHLKDPNTSPTLQIIQLIMDKFEILEFYHINRENNTLADDQGNKCIDFVEGNLMDDGHRITICHIP